MGKYLGFDPQNWFPIGRLIGISDGPRGDTKADGNGPVLVKGHSSLCSCSDLEQEIPQRFVQKFGKRFNRVITNTTSRFQPICTALCHDTVDIKGSTIPYHL